MSIFPSEQLEKLMTEQKWDEVKAVLEKWADEDLEDGDLLSRTRAYVRLKTEIEKEYLAELQEILALAKELRDDEGKFKAAGKVADVKKKIKGL